MINARSEIYIVSIVVPVYNTASFLDECLSSLVGQTLREIEIICVNDGSTDNSLEILNAWARRDSRIAVIDCKVNQGVGYARNTAIKAAKGRYMAFVDSDDYVSRDMFSSLIEASENLTADIVVSNLFARHSSRDIPQLQFPSNLKDSDEIRKHAVVNNCQMWTNIYKRELFAENGLWFPDHLHYEDVANGIPLLLLAENLRILYNREPLYFYRVSNASITRSMNDNKHWDRLTTAGMFLDNTQRLGLYDKYKDEIEWLFYRFYVMNSFSIAIFSFSRYQIAKVREIKAEYESFRGYESISNNPVYKHDISLQKSIAMVVYHFPLSGYLFWVYGTLKRKICNL